MNSKTSAIVLGTMRLHDKGLSRSQCLSLFQHAIDRGVDTFHISAEYSSFPLVADTILALPQRYKARMKVIAKIASPHFGEGIFNAEFMERRINDLREALKIEKIDVVQWMWRDNEISDECRINNLKSSASEIIGCFNSIRSRGLACDIGCFPYSAAFMREVRSQGISDLHINYLNWWETPLLDGGIGSSAIVLRPFGAGRLFDICDSEALDSKQVNNSLLLHHALAYPLSHPAIKSVVVGINTIRQLDEALDATEECGRGLDVFKNYRVTMNEFFGNAPSSS